MRAVDRNGKSRCAGQRPGDQAHKARRVDPDCIFKSQARETGRTDDQECQYDQCFSFRTEGVEETGARLYADGENEQYQAEISQFLRNDYPEMAEQESDKDNG